MLTRLIRSVLGIVGLCILFLALWRLFGGDIGALMNGIGGFLWMLIDGGADVLAKLFNSATAV